MTIRYMEEMQGSLEPRRFFLQVFMAPVCTTGFLIKRRTRPMIRETRDGIEGETHWKIWKRARKKQDTVNTQIVDGSYAQNACEI